VPVPGSLNERDQWAAAALCLGGHAEEVDGHLVRRAPIPGDSWAHSPRILVADYVARHGPGVSVADVEAHLRTASGGPIAPASAARIAVRHLLGSRVLTLDAEGLSVVRGAG